MVQVRSIYFNLHTCQSFQAGTNNRIVARKKQSLQEENIHKIFIRQINIIGKNRQDFKLKALSLGLKRTGRIQAGVKVRPSSSYFNLIMLGHLRDKGT